MHRVLCERGRRCLQSRPPVQAQKDKTTLAGPPWTGSCFRHHGSEGEGATKASGKCTRPRALSAFHQWKPIGGLSGRAFPGNRCLGHARTLGVGQTPADYDSGNGDFHHAGCKGKDHVDCRQAPQQFCRAFPRATDVEVFARTRGTRRAAAGASDETRHCKTNAHYTRHSRTTLSCRQSRG